MRERQPVWIGAVMGLLVLASLAVVHAETTVLSTEATYTMGEGETMLVAEAMALQKAKQLALEQAGSYVESYSQVQHYQLTAEEIQTVTGGVLQVEVLEKTRELVGDGLKFFVKIKATVTTDQVARLAGRLKGKATVSDYRQLQEQYAALSTEIESLKRLITTTPAGPERDRALQRIQQQGIAFLATQHQETRWYQQLVSGPDLAQDARGQVASKLAAREKLEQLFQWMMTQGYEIHVGKPSVTTSLANPDRAAVSIEVAVALTPAAREKLAILAEELGGQPAILRDAIQGGSCYDRYTIVRPLVLSRDPDIQHRLEEIVTRQELTIRLLASDRTVLGHTVLPLSPQPIQGMPCHGHYTYFSRKASRRNKAPYWSPLLVNEYSNGPSQIFVLDGSWQVRVTWDMAVDAVQALQSVETGMASRALSH